MFKSESETNCDIQSGSCASAAGDAVFILDITPKPVEPMRDLVFRVNAEGLRPETQKIALDLSMPGMKMGKNVVTLKRTSDGAYEGTGVIVRCPSGRRTWKATVIAPGTKHVEFIFDVAS